MNDIQIESSKAALCGAKYQSGDQIVSSLISSRSSLNNPLSTNPCSANPGSLSGTVAIINIPDSNETLDSQTAGTSARLEPELAIVRISTL
jgi:hypothetical protein